MNSSTVFPMKISTKMSNTFVKVLNGEPANRFVLGFFSGWPFSCKSDPLTEAFLRST